MAIRTDKQIQSRSFIALLIIFGGIILLLAAMILSIIYGAADIDLPTIWQSLTQFDPSLTAHQIIRNLRIPRGLAAALVGASLAVSGAIMQGMTRNALASPSIMGVTAGASFMIAVAMAVSSQVTTISLAIWAFAGAGLGAGIVFGVGTISKSGLTPVKLALAGTAVTSMLSALSSGIAIHFNIAKDMSFWYAGGVASVQWVHVKLLAPIVIIGLILALLLSKSITVLNLGEDVARGLGQRTVLTKTVATIVVLLLTGAAVSVAGTVGFIGLVIPHITRFLVGVKYQWIIPAAAVLGALLLVLADTASRMVNPPFETPVGTMTALVGVPFFLYLARREGRGM
ncbi:iron ABC transporter permease [Gracilibacillus caseinilyticus]|uniref:Iron ABC transporter permease n=1 Tax=Gracilibacillus caseinilyticus TaxID=2932256 RepID=A0ABY4EZV7_9BACI|nr:iron ABC transporter permease [Gracilibacillus caseinilyticus]UOQ49944.1 iron ABC transporter permease [Gracilibacillus caseinilyticus]